MKFFLLMLATGLLLATGALAADSTVTVSLPGLETRLVKEMTDTQVLTAFPGQTFEQHDSAGAATESWSIDIVTEDYDYRLTLDFANHTLRAVHLLPADAHGGMTVWFDGQMAALPADASPNLLDVRGNKLVEEWQTPQLRYVSDYTFNEHQSVESAEYTITFK